MSSFICTDNTDIANFLHEKTIKYKQLGKARTYLFFDEEKLERGLFVIVGYFSLALKTLILPESTSTNRRKVIDGFYGKLHGHPIREVSCYLIGQIAKNSSLNQYSLSGKDLLENALATIIPATEIVGGRWVLVECQNIDKLLNFYKENGFEYVAREPDDQEEMVQMIRRIG